MSSYRIIFEQNGRSAIYTLLHAMLSYHPYLESFKTIGNQWKPWKTIIHRWEADSNGSNSYANDVTEVNPLGQMPIYVSYCLLPFPVIKNRRNQMSMQVKIV